MGRYFFMISWLFIITVADAQQANSAITLTHYVFDSFSMGTVQVKSGAVSKQLLNYNILTNEMIFEDSGRMLAIGNSADVDTVFIRGRKFIPVNEKFYEVLLSITDPLFLEFTCTINEPGASVGYGNASPTTNATSYKSLLSNGGVYDIRLPDDFKVVPGFIYWIRRNNRFMKTGTARQLIGIYPGKKDAISTFIKDHHTSFLNRKDVIGLVQNIQQQ